MLQSIPYDRETTPITCPVCNKTVVNQHQRTPCEHTLFILPDHWGVQGGFRSDQIAEEIEIMIAGGKTDEEICEIYANFYKDAFIVQVWVTDFLETKQRYYCCFSPEPKMYKSIKISNALPFSMELADGRQSCCFCDSELEATTTLDYKERKKQSRIPKGDRVCRIRYNSGPTGERIACMNHMQMLQTFLNGMDFKH